MIVTTIITYLSENVPNIYIKFYFRMTNSTKNRTASIESHGIFVFLYRIEQIFMNTKAEWNKIIESKLKEGQSLLDLQKVYDSGIVMEPNIVADEVAELKHQLSDLKPWINMASIKGETASDINSLALQALNHGANGLNIILDTSLDINATLEGIMTEYLDVRIDCSLWSEEEIAAERNKIDTNKYPNLRWVGSGSVKTINIQPKDRVAQIKSALAHMDQDSSYDIIITLSKNLLFEIASLRAIRIALQRKGYIHYNLLARYDVEGTNDLGDYNLIEKTYKVMSGIMGCADAILTTYIGDEDSRLSLNIHNVLELESGFKDVMDPVGGAYYVEKLVDEILEGVED